MYRFSGLNYVRPDYMKEQAILQKYRDEAPTAASYEKARHAELRKRVSKKVLQTYK